MIFDLIYAIQKRIYRFLLKPFLGSLGKKSFIISPMRIEGISNINIGNNTNIMKYCWIIVQNKKFAQLHIGNNTYIGNFSHIDCAKNIIIGDNVTIADKVYIVDYNIEIFIKDEKLILGSTIAKNIKIGNNCWIGESAIIIASSIGDNVVIGAGTVVRNDIPSNCIVAGNPGIIIKKI